MRSPPDLPKLDVTLGQSQQQFDDRGLMGAMVAVVSSTRVRERLQADRLDELDTTTRHAPDDEGAIIINGLEATVGVGVRTPLEDDRVARSAIRRGSHGQLVASARRGFGASQRNARNLGAGPVR
jgi:hypothetical protein